MKGRKRGLSYFSFRVQNLYFIFFNLKKSPGGNLPQIKDIASRMKVIVA